jgi:lysophospholipase L1-like esterase
MKVIFSFLLTITALSGCAKKNADTTVAAVSITKTNNTPGTPVAGAFNYLALGDSYTIGQSVPIDQSFPYQLAAALNLQIKVNTPTIVAVTGWTTDNLISAVSTDGGNKSYDFVTLLIGVNDQFQGNSRDIYRASFIKILNSAVLFAKGNKNRVFVISIPDYGVTPFAAGQNRAAIGQQIDLFNAINKDESTKAGVNYLDITDISRQAANDASLIATDGLHPSGKMYGLWVQRLAPLIKAQLDK